MEPELKGVQFSKHVDDALHHLAIDCKITHAFETKVRKSFKSNKRKKPLPVTDTDLNATPLDQIAAHPMRTGKNYTFVKGRKRAEKRAMVSKAYGVIPPEPRQIKGLRMAETWRRD